MKYQFSKESGRSMVEMLGVLAVIGVLSIGGIMGYSYAMDKSRANSALNDIRLRAVTLQTQNAMGRNLDLSEYDGMNTVYPITVANDIDGYGMVVSNVPQRVCEMIYTGTQGWATVQIDGAIMESADSCGDTNNMTFAFNPDGEIAGENGDGNGGNDNNETDTEKDDNQIQCEEGYFPFEGQCYTCKGDNYAVSCGPEGIVCPDGGYLYDGYCTGSAGCDDLESRHGYCTSDGYACEPGYVKVGSYCGLTCGENMELNGDSCICKDGYYLQGNSGGCSSCYGGTSNGHRCLTCGSGYYKNDNGGCSSCPSNSTCTQDGFTCKDGYYKSDSYCDSCPSNSTCTSATDFTCKDGYYTNSSGTCSSCPSNSISCTSATDFTCKNGYYKSGSYCYSCNG